MKRKNTDIQTLINEYEAELCDHSNMEWVSRAALRYVDTMDDCQVRCLLYVLAMHVRSQLPNA